MRRLEIGGGKVTEDVATGVTSLELPAGCQRYCDAQIDDYGGRRRNKYPWTPGTQFTLRARFSPGQRDFIGTAGFGFWNAPFGDPTSPWPALPRAAWFFYGSPPNDFPVAPDQPGRGWYASTVDATSWQALAMAPLALPTILLNQSASYRRRFWPQIQTRLGMSFQPLEEPWGEWHNYGLIWRRSGCEFLVDGVSVHQTTQSPVGNMGFVGWVDNQFLLLTPTGRFKSGTMTTSHSQRLEIAQLKIGTVAN